MEVDIQFLKLKIAQFEQAAIRFHEESIANKGAAEGLRNVIKELEALEKSPTLSEEELLKLEVVDGKVNSDIGNK